MEGGPLHPAHHPGTLESQRWVTGEGEDGDEEESFLKIKVGVEEMDITGSACK